METLYLIIVNDTATTTFVRKTKKGANHVASVLRHHGYDVKITRMKAADFCFA